MRNSKQPVPYGRGCVLARDREFPYHPASMKRKPRLIISAVIFATLATVALPDRLSAGNWGHWRGPFFNGSTTETNLPSTWSTNDNIAWVAPLPGISGSTPVIWSDRIFVSTPDSDHNLALVCYNR